MKRVEIVRSEESLGSWAEEKLFSDLFLGSGSDNSESLEARIEDRVHDLLSTGVILSRIITQSQKTQV